MLRAATKAEGLVDGVGIWRAEATSISEAEGPGIKWLLVEVFCLLGGDFWVGGRLFAGLVNDFDLGAGVGLLEAAGVVVVVVVVEEADSEAEEDGVGDEEAVLVDRVVKGC